MDTQGNDCDDNEEEEAGHVIDIRNVAFDSVQDR
jgi:hypothetical protein